MMTWSFLPLTIGLLLLVCIGTVTSMPTDTSDRRPGSSSSRGQHQKHSLPNPNIHKKQETEHDTTVKTASTPQTRLDSSTTTESHQDSSTTTESTQDSSTTTESHQDSSTTTESTQDSSTTTESHQDSSTTTESHQDSSTTTESTQDSSTTPEYVQDSSTTPEYVQDSSTTSTTVVPCVDEHGVKLAIGQQVLYRSTCQSCICSDFGLICDQVHCPTLVCVNSVRRRDGCCDVCANDSSAAPEYVQDSSTTPEFVQDSSTTPEFVQDSSTTPEYVQDSSTTPEYVQDSSTTTEYVQDSSTTTEYVQDLSTTPEYVQDSSTTSTTVVPCVDEHGEKLAIGQQVLYRSTCQTCTCFSFGLFCDQVHCPTPMCVDSVWGQDECCRLCPNGTNCIIEETGKIISTIEELDSRVCWCPPPTNYLPLSPEESPKAICEYLTSTTTSTTTTTPPTTSPETCVGEWGEMLSVGQQVVYQRTLTCNECECSSTGFLNCTPRRCEVPRCVDYSTSQRGCCYFCPNGRNCRLKETGQIISSPVMLNGLLCVCPVDNDPLPDFLLEGGPVAVCTPPETTTYETTPETTTYETTPETTTITTTPTTTPPLCIGDRGETVPPGEQVIYPGFLACKVCGCLPSGFFCDYRDCIIPMCVNSTQGVCCHQCLDGPNCRIENSGEIISSRVVRNNTVCECPSLSYGSHDFLSEGGPIAICTPLPNTTTSTTSDTTPETTFMTTLP